MRKPQLAVPTDIGPKLELAELMEVRSVLAELKKATQTVLLFIIWVICKFLKNYTEISAGVSLFVSATHAL